MSKLLAWMSLIFLAYGMGILVMINGWGLQPVSWGWIVGGAFAHLLITGIGHLVSQED